MSINQIEADIKVQVYNTSLFLGGFIEGVVFESRHIMQIL